MSLSEKLGSDRVVAGIVRLPGMGFLGKEGGMLLVRCAIAKVDGRETGS